MVTGDLYYLWNRLYKQIASRNAHLLATCVRGFREETIICSSGYPLKSELQLTPSLSIFLLWIMPPHDNKRDRYFTLYDYSWCNQIQPKLSLACRKKTSWCPSPMWLEWQRAGGSPLTHSDVTTRMTNDNTSLTTSQACSWGVLENQGGRQKDKNRVVIEPELSVLDGLWCDAQF